MSVTSTTTPAPTTPAPAAHSFFQSWRINGFKEPLILRVQDANGCPLYFEEEHWKELENLFQTFFADLKKSPVNSISLICNELDPKKASLSYAVSYVNGETNTQALDPKQAAEIGKNLQSTFLRCVEKKGFYTASATAPLLPIGGPLPPPPSPSPTATSGASTTSASSTTPTTATAAASTSSPSTSATPSSYTLPSTVRIFPGERAQRTSACTMNAGLWAARSLKNEISDSPTPNNLNTILEDGERAFRIIHENRRRKNALEKEKAQFFLDNKDLDDVALQEKLELAPVDSWQRDLLESLRALHVTPDAFNVEVRKNQEIIANPPPDLSHLSAPEVYSSLPSGISMYGIDKHTSNFKLKNRGDDFAALSSKETQANKFWHALIHPLIEEATRSHKAIGAILTSTVKLSDTTYEASYGIKISLSPSPVFQFYNSHTIENQLIQFVSEEDLINYLSNNIPFTPDTETETGKTGIYPMTLSAASEDSDDEDSDDDEYDDATEYTGPARSSAASPARLEEVD